MRSSLKRSAFIGDAALKAANESKYEIAIRLSIYSPALKDALNDVAINDELRSAHVKLLEQHELNIALIAACYKIRGQLARANIEHGVSDYLNQVKALTTEEGRLTTLIQAVQNAPSSQEKTPSAAIARGKAARETPTDRYLGRSEDGVTVSIVTDADIAAWRNRLAHIVDQKSRLNDAMTKANVTNFIELDTVTVETLRRAKILMASD